MNKIFSMTAIALAVALAGCSSDDDDDDVPVIDDTPDVVANTPAVFGGDSTGDATKEDTDAVTGALTITDPDDGEAAVVAQTDTAGDYGTFSITADGTWTYTLDATNTSVSSLANEEDSIVDTFNVASVDGVVTQIAITIVGVPADQIAKVADTDDSDTAELYYYFGTDADADPAVDNGLTTGKVSLKLLYDTNETQTAYLSLYDAEGSTKTVIGELALDTGKFGLRANTFEDGLTPNKDNSASSSVDYDTFTAPDFVPGEWLDIAMTWDTSSTTDAGTYSVMIDGTSYGPFTSQHPTPGVKVEHITVRLASNSSLSDDAIYVNDLAIYSDVAGTTAIFEDNFDDNYTVGDSLEDENDASPYGSRTNEATVVIYGQDDSDDSDDTSDSANTEVFVSTAADVAPGTSGNKFASIVDTTSSDAGELRLKLGTDNRIVKGRMTASFSKTAAATCTVGDSVKDAYIGVHGTPSSTYDAIVDLRIDGTDYDTDFAIRKNNVSGDKTVGIDNATFAADTWTDVEITWDASAADATTNPLVTVSIDGTSVGDAWNSYSAATGGLSDGAHYFTFRLGDSSAQMDSCNFKVDNITIYASDDSDVETMIFGENFEDYADNTDLETVTLADGTTLLYNSATQEATVASEQ